jgi:ATP-dependent DNA ligase
MLARSSERLPTGRSCVYEPKWDGFRAALTPFSITSRNARDLTRYFTDLVAAAEASLPAGTVLDGEIVSPIGAGVSFERLQSRLSSSVPRAPAAIIAFDVLEVEGQDLRRLPLSDRRALLEGLVGIHPAIGLNPQVSDPSESAGWLSGSVPGIEGVVAKRSTEAYLPGVRGWVKVKRRDSVDVVVGGFRNRSVLLGLYDGDGLLGLEPVSWTVVAPFPWRRVG